MTGRHTRRWFDSISIERALSHNVRVLLLTGGGVLVGALRAMHVQSGQHRARARRGRAALARRARSSSRALRKTPTVSAAASGSGQKALLNACARSSISPGRCRRTRKSRSITDSLRQPSASTSRASESYLHETAGSGPPGRSPISSRGAPPSKRDARCNAAHARRAAARGDARLDEAGRSSRRDGWVVAGSSPPRSSPR